MSELLSKKDVAARLQCCERTVDNLRAAGQLVSFKMRGLVRFTPKAVQDYIDRISGKVIPENG